MQGMLDPITTGAMGAYTAQQVPGAQLICYDDLAHMPFWEAPQRFNADLAQFLSRVTAESPPETQDTRFAMLYTELRQIAQRELHRSGDNGALSPTTILHEAYLKLQQRPATAIPARGEFLAYASRVMRNLVIDMVRRRQAIKRGGGFEITSLPNSPPEWVADTADLESLGSAIDALSARDPALAELVDLKFFCGFSFVEIATVRGVSERTVQRDWEKARILLRKAFEDLKT
jgi:RNA polymerase sigma factor (TIGR02999 family)